MSVKENAFKAENTVGTNIKIKFAYLKCCITVNPNFVKISWHFVTKKEPGKIPVNYATKS